LNLYFATQTGEATILGQRAASLTELHDPVFRNEKLASFIAVGRVVDLRPFKIDVKVVAQNARLAKAMNVPVGVKDEPTASEILSYVFDSRVGRSASLAELNPK
jgi:hypothetical protein